MEHAPTQSENILFVDDEVSIVKVGEQMFQRLGYRVEALSDPVAALETFRADPHRFHLVVLDMTMPHMTGDQLTKEIRDIRSDVPIILCSGYSDMIDGRKASELGVQALMMKPMIMGEIARVVRQVLDAHIDE